MDIPIQLAASVSPPMRIAIGFALSLLFLTPVVLRQYNRWWTVLAGLTALGQISIGITDAEMSTDGEWRESTMWFPNLFLGLAMLLFVVIIVRTIRLGKKEKSELRRSEFRATR